MKAKTLPILLTYFLFASFTTAPETSVYLCNSSGGKRYHFSENCQGLSNCKHEIIKVSLQETKKRGKTICGYED